MKKLRYSRGQTINASQTWHSFQYLFYHASTTGFSHVYRITHIRTWMIASPQSPIPESQLVRKCLSPSLLPSIHPSSLLTNHPRMFVRQTPIDYVGTLCFFAHDRTVCYFVYPHASGCCIVEVISCSGDCLKVWTFCVGSDPCKIKSSDCAYICPFLPTGRIKV